MSILYGPADFEAGTLAGFSTSGTVSASTTQKHAGSWSASFAANNGGINYIRRGYTTVPLGTRVFYGKWVWIPSIPVTNSLFLDFLETTAFGAAAGIAIDTAGRIQLQDSLGANIVTGAVIVPSTWTNIEYSCAIPVSGSTSPLQLIVNSVDQGSATGTVGTNQMNQSRAGQTASFSTGIATGYLDDIQINDDTGGSNNSWPSGYTPPAAGAAWAAVV